MTYNPLLYWPARYRRQGVNYVGPGGRAEQARIQAAAVAPFLDRAVVGDSVLDFGCGPQRFRPILESGNREYQGIDLIPGMGTMTFTDQLPASRFDCVVALWVLQHLVAEDDYIHWAGQLYRTLRPGGRLVVVDALPDPGVSWAPHMRPRGMETLRATAPWAGAVLDGHRDDCWMGWLTKPGDINGDHGDGDVGLREGVAGVWGTADPGSPGSLRIPAAPGHAERWSPESGDRNPDDGTPGAGHGEGRGAGSIALVASDVTPGEGPTPSDPDPSRAVEDTVSGDRSGDTLAGDGDQEWRPGLDRVALILGGGDCVWCDVEALRPLVGGRWAEKASDRPCHANGKRTHNLPVDWPGPVLAANDVACHWPHRLDHLCTLHPEKLKIFGDGRRANGLADGYVTWAARKHTAAQRISKRWNAEGSSGLLAVGVARDLEVRLAILCGVGMEKAPHFVDSTMHPYGRLWTGAEAHWKSWKREVILKQITGWVRSMSGRTRDLLGAPDGAWLDGDQREAA